jgi:MinD superfamily P-loop ATPase
MRVVVASGKGGTGKTMVATSLALVASELGPVALVDDDVEAPNAALFLQPTITERRSVEQLSPVVDQLLCTHCGRCAEVCQFNAIASLPQSTLVFTALCHGCGSCMLNCPTGAISEQARPIGMIETGHAQGMSFGQGVLVVGEAMATPIIRELGKQVSARGWDSQGLVVVDAPPGSACPVIEALSSADVALLVTEPTPFGLHDLKIAVEVARDVLDRPVAIVINKDGPGDRAMDEYCAQEGLPVLLRIPLERRIAEAYSSGQPLVSAFPEYRTLFRALLLQLAAMALGRAS